MKMAIRLLRRPCAGVCRALTLSRTRYDGLKHPLSFCIAPLATSVPHHQYQHAALPRPRHVCALPATSTYQWRPLHTSPASQQPADPYSLLGVSRSASASEIKQAYFRRAKACHPDICPNDPAAEQQFKELSAAYSILGNADKRRQYDMHGYADDNAGGVWEEDTDTISAEDIFFGVWEDFASLEIKNEISDFVDEFGDAARQAMRGDLMAAAAFVRHNAGVFATAGVVILLVRSPAVIRLLLQGGIWIGMLVLRILSQNPHMVRGMLTHLWRFVVRRYKGRSSGRKRG